MSRSPGPDFMSCFVRRLSYSYFCVFKLRMYRNDPSSPLHGKSLRDYASNTILCGTRPYPAFSEVPRCKDSVGNDFFGGGASSTQFFN